MKEAIILYSWAQALGYCRGPGSLILEEPPWGSFNPLLKAHSAAVKHSLNSSFVFSAPLSASRNLFPAGLDRSFAVEGTSQAVLSSSD
jgi:hypothetical protein